MKNTNSYVKMFLKSADELHDFFVKFIERIGFIKSDDFFFSCQSSDFVLLKSRQFCG